MTLNRSDIMTAAWKDTRDLIRSVQGRFASVTFIKKDGSMREMRVRPAKLKYHVKGHLASPSAQRAT